MVAVAAVALVPGGAGAKKRRPNYLWATVNVCDTKTHPNRMGLRARLPGNGRRQRMYMRFTAQYHAKKGWRRVKKSRSGWEYAGSARYRWREAGFTFGFTKPSPGASYEMRGYVQYQWREKRPHGKGWRVVRRSHRITSAGHHAAYDGDPKGYSAAHCTISTPPKLP